MSIATAFTFLSKVFSKFSATFALFFGALAGSYYMGIINEFVFFVFFIGLLVMLFIDVGISFYLSQHKKIKLAFKEEKYIDENYIAYRESLQKKKKTETPTDIIKDIGVAVGSGIGDLLRPKKETDAEKKERLEKELKNLES